MSIRREACRVWGGADANIVMKVLFIQSMMVIDMSDLENVLGNKSCVEHICFT